MSDVLKAVLPMPISANVYWRTRVFRGVSMTYVSPEAKVFKDEVRYRILETGFREKIEGNVKVQIKLFPKRPQDWSKRLRIDGKDWVNTVRRIDLDNSIKTLLDAFQGFVFEDDKQVTFIQAQVCDPDEFGPRVEVVVCKDE